MMKTACRTCKGQFHQYNEDAWSQDLKRGIFLLADGLGGHGFGHVASGFVMEKLASRLRQGVDEGEYSPDISSQERLQRLGREIREVSAALYKVTHHQSADRKMGCTLCVVLIQGNEALYAHVGDSRVYLFRDYCLGALTQDHSLANASIKNGELEPEDLQGYKWKHVVTQAMGTLPEIEPDLGALQLQANDMFLICSDGLTDSTSDESVGAILKGEATLEEKVATLVSGAKDAGAKDDITALLIHFSS